MAKNYTDETLEIAVAVCLNDNTSYKKIASMFGIPKSTLHDKVFIFI